MDISTIAGYVITGISSVVLVFVIFNSFKHYKTLKHHDKKTQYEN
jgi:uncharacterized membrane protein YuzA (DUF378 family)